MKKQMKKWILPCAAALFTIGASMTAFAAQGWTMEGDNWGLYRLQRKQSDRCLEEIRRQLVLSRFIRRYGQEQRH